MVARGGACALILYELGDLERSAEEADKAWKLARRIGARQFEGNSQKHLGRGLTALGRREEAAALLEEGVAVCRETGFRFMGPELLSALAVATDDPATRERALTEGEAILLSGCPSHNYLFFYRDAIEASLAVGTWDEAERYAAALKDYTRPEPLPWADFVIARGGGWHKHSAPVYVYLSEGLATLELEDGKLDHFQAGEAVIEPANTVMRTVNRSATEPAVFVIFQVSDPEQPFSEAVTK